MSTKVAHNDLIESTAEVKDTENTDVADAIAMTMVHNASAADATAVKARPRATPQLQPQTQAQSDEALAAALALEYGGSSLTAAEKVRLRRLARRQRDGSSISSTSSSLCSSGENKASAASRSCSLGEPGTKMVKQGRKKAKKKRREALSGGASVRVEVSGSSVATSTRAEAVSGEAEAAVFDAVAAAKRKRKRGRPPKKKDQKKLGGFAMNAGNSATVSPFSTPSVPTTPHDEASKFAPAGKKIVINKVVLGYGSGGVDDSGSDDEANANASAADAAFAAFGSGGFVQKKAGEKSTARALVLETTEKCPPLSKPRKKRGRPPKNKPVMTLPRASCATGSASSTAAGRSDSSGGYGSAASANARAALDVTGSLPYLVGSCGNAGPTDVGTTNFGDYCLTAAEKAKLRRAKQAAVKAPPPPQSKATDFDLATLAAFGEFTLTAAEKAKLRRARAAAQSPTAQANSEEEEVKEMRKKRREQKRKEKLEREEAARVEFLRRVGLLPMEEDMNHSEHCDHDHEEDEDYGAETDLHHRGRVAGAPAVLASVVPKPEPPAHVGSSSCNEVVEAGIGRKRKRGRPTKKALSATETARIVGPVGELGHSSIRQSRARGRKSNNGDSNRRNGGFDFAHLLSPRNFSTGIAANALSLSFRPPLLELSDAELAQLSKSFSVKSLPEVDAEASKKEQSRRMGAVSAGVGCVLTLPISPLHFADGEFMVGPDEAEQILRGSQGAHFLGRLMSCALDLPQDTISTSSPTSSSAKRKKKRGRPPKKKKVTIPKVECSSNDNGRSQSNHNGSKNKRLCGLRNALTHLLCETSDGADVVLEAWEHLAGLTTCQNGSTDNGDDFSLASLARAMTREELALWSCPIPSSASKIAGDGASPRGLAFLRRLALPLCCRLVPAEAPTLSAQARKPESPSKKENKLSAQDPAETNAGTFPLVIAKYSLLDVLLQVRLLRQSVVDALLRRILELDGLAHPTTYMGFDEAENENLAKKQTDDKDSDAEGEAIEKAIWSPKGLIVASQARHMRSLLLRSLGNALRDIPSAPVAAPSLPRDTIANAADVAPYTFHSMPTQFPLSPLSSVQPSEAPAHAHPNLFDASDQATFLHSVRCAIVLARKALSRSPCLIDSLHRVLLSVLPGIRQLGDEKDEGGISVEKALRWGRDAGLLPIEMNADSDIASVGAVKTHDLSRSSCRMERLSCQSPRILAERFAVRRERERLMREYALKTEKERAAKVNADRRSGRKIRPQGRSFDGSLIITSHDMHIDDFLRRSQLMSKVNETLPRTSVPYKSKPTLQSLYNLLKPDAVQELKALFFDEDGSLRDAVRADIDTSIKNDPRYINFRNRTCPAERQDKRWQVPLRHHSAGREISTRKRVEEIFARDKIIVAGCEAVDDIGLLFGGTEDQPLHHDTARQMTSWMTEKPLTDDAAAGGVIDSRSGLLEPVAGWEIDRIEYNVAMSSPYAPGSIIIGLGDEDWVLLGVQKDHVEKMGDGVSCKIHGGRPDEVYPIVRENEHLVVVEIKAGCMFTGDFPHAGVRNFPADSPDDDLLVDLNMRISAINARFPPHERVLRSKAMVEMMCNFKGLSRLCRLHCSTEMLEGHICVPPNTIGFTGCLPNLPDRRCFEGDKVPECYKNVDDVKGCGQADSDDFGDSSSSGAGLGSTSENTESQKNKELQCRNGGSCSNGQSSESHLGANNACESFHNGSLGVDTTVDKVAQIAGNQGRENGNSSSRLV